MHGLYRPSYVKQILSGVKNSNDSIETRHDNFSHLYSKSCEHSGWFVKKAEAERGDDAPSNFSLRLPAGENVSREAARTRGRSNAVLYRWF